MSLDQRFPEPTRFRRLLAVIGTCPPAAIRNCLEMASSVTDCYWMLVSAAPDPPIWTVGDFSAPIN